MFKKLAILSLSTVILGGCSLQTMVKTNDAAKDSQSPAPAMTKPEATVTTSPDAALLQANPSTSPANDDKSLETDINNTNVVKEDFSDLNQ